MSPIYKLEIFLSLPFFGFQTLIFWFLLGGDQTFVRLLKIRVEAAEVIMHLKVISGVYDNWLGAGNFLTFEIPGPPIVHNNNNNSSRVSVANLLTVTTKVLSCYAQLENMVRIFYY